MVCICSGLDITNLSICSGAGWESVDPTFTVCRDANPWEESCVQPPCGQLDPTLEGVYEVLAQLYTDLLNVFSHPPTFHLGGDEVDIRCWNSTQTVVTFLQQNVGPDPLSLSC